MAKNRQQFLEGYAAGWKDGLAARMERVVASGRIRVKDRFTDPVVRYVAGPGRKSATPPVSMATGRVRVAHARLDGLVEDIKAFKFRPQTGTELQFDDMLADKRKFHTRQPSATELAILGKRKPCFGEAMCPVQPGCHICGLTREEIAILDKHKKRGI